MIFQAIKAPEWTDAYDVAYGFIELYEINDDGEYVVPSLNDAYSCSELLPP
jgi:hypothetical protein